jgi:serine/threonine protein kinase
MGTVYLAEGGGRQVALKVVRPELADQPDFRSRFAREAEASSRVSGPYTAEVVAFDVRAQQQWIATQYIPGPTLDEYLAKRGPLSDQQAVIFALGLAEALATIHEAGLAHRDLKPSNVLLTSSGPLVIDFGIARAIDATAITRSGEVLGSPAWMAPEQLAGDEASQATDVFAWGCVVTLSCTGQHPFTAGPPEAMAFRIMEQPPKLNGLPSVLLPLVTQSLEKLPAGRPSSADLVGRVFVRPELTESTVVETIAGHWDPNLASQPTTVTIANRPNRMIRVMVAGLVLTVLAATGLGAWSLWRDGTTSATADRAQGNHPTPSASEEAAQPSSSMSSQPEPIGSFQLICHWTSAAKVRGRCAPGPKLEATVWRPTTETLRVLATIDDAFTDLREGRQDLFTGRVGLYSVRLQTNRIDTDAWARWDVSGTTRSASGEVETLNCRGPRVEKNDGADVGDFLAFEDSDRVHGSWSGSSEADGEVFAGLCALLTTGMLRSDNYFIV